MHVCTTIEEEKTNRNRKEERTEENLKVKMRSQEMTY